MLFCQKARKCLKTDYNIQSGWKGFWGRMYTCINITKCFHCSLESISTQLIGYTSVQNVFGIKKGYIKKNKKQNKNDGKMTKDYRGQHKEPSTGQILGNLLTDINSGRI